MDTYNEQYIKRDENFVGCKKIQNKYRNILIGTIKHSGQIAYEHIPYVQLIDLYNEKGLISDIPIPKNTLGYNGRIAQIIPHTGYMYTVIGHGKQIIIDAEETLGTVLTGGYMPENVSTETRIMMISLVLSYLIYLGMIKVGDGKQVLKEYKNKRRKKQEEREEKIDNQKIANVEVSEIVV